MSRSTRQILIIVALAAVVLVGLWCSSASPLRGRWSGTFEGTVAGQVQLTIGLRGSSLSGSMEGQTRGGEPFSADVEGRLAGDRLEAVFSGSGRGGPLGIGFEGTMAGDVEGDRITGTWRAEVRRAGEMSGTWSVERTP